ncbi:MAG: AI-2E family transporter [Clostridia bacterium]|nr:AI-2E family transporter [Clostridia bacterium]
MKPYQNRKYLTFAVYAGIVLCLGVALVFLFLNFDAVGRFFTKFFDVCMPLIYGAFIAYILNPLMKFFEEKVFRSKKDGGLSRTARRALSVGMSMLSLFLFLALFISMIVPQLVISIQDIALKFPDYLDELQKLANSIAQTGGFVAEAVESLLASLNSFMDRSYELLQEYLPLITTYLQSFATAVFDIILGLVFAVYFLCAKEHISAQAKKLANALFSAKYYEKILYIVTLTDKTFGKYFVGAILDSLLVGFICFLLVQLFGMPYAPLIGVVIGITNIIPIFGPFIGAIPSAIILFVHNPAYAFYFAIMILVVQQIDGNIIAPRIHGASTGLAPVWIITAITVMSGFFGIVGMFIGVPCFSVLYTLIKQYVEGKLEKKSFSTDTLAYMNKDARKYYQTNDTPKKSVKEEFRTFIAKFSKKKNKKS